MRSRLYQKDECERQNQILARTGFNQEAYRSEFRRDYARLIHSPAFRRLQGKTQLFPGRESDFFRNRLTHSLEVAQIAKSIAIRINSKFQPFNDKSGTWRIDPDLVEFAGLAHDLGHPPFGHNGEAALDECMKKFGGFEGNAQTLRILSKLEKKEVSGAEYAPISSDGIDIRLGLNLTYRTLASVLKYDQVIPFTRDKNSKLEKGYYSSEADLVQAVKDRVGLGCATEEGQFKTIECSIMDLADDIAYSTYDFEDALKAGFLNLLDPVTLGNDSDLHNRVALKVWKKVEGRKDVPAAPGDVSREHEKKLAEYRDLVTSVFVGLVEDLFDPLQQALQDSDGSDGNPNLVQYVVGTGYHGARRLQQDGYLRTEFTSRLVNEFIQSVRLKRNKDNLALSGVTLPKEVKIKIEAIKNYTYEAHILSPRLQIIEHRGKDFVRRIFKALSRPNGYMLFPPDWKDLYMSLSDEAERKRTICDFIAGMTDNYAIEFYGRLYSENPQTIFKDH